MAGFDVSDVAAHVAVPQQTNPFQTIEGLANLQNSLNNNRMFQAKALAGQYLQQTIGQDGLPDLGQLNKFLKSDPRTAAFSPEIMQDATTLRHDTLANQQQQYALHTGEMDRALGVLGAAYGQSPAEASRALDTLVSAGIISQQTRSLPQFSTDEGIAAAQQRAIMSGGSAQEQGALLGTNQTENLGGTNQIVNVKTAPGQAPVATTAMGDAAALANTLSPGEANTPAYQQYNPETHQMETVTKAQAASRAPNEPIPAEPPLGAVAQANAAATGAVSQGQGVENAIVGAAADSQGRRAALGSVIGLAKNLDTGPNAGFWKGLGQLASEYGVQTPIVPGAGQTAAMEALDKIAEQVAQRQFQVLGGTGANAQLESALKTSPHSGLSKIGIQNIAGFLQGNEDAIQAQSNALQKWKAMPQNAGHPENNARFLNVWNKVYDPRLFQMKYEDAAGKAAMLSGMSVRERADFDRRQKILQDMGYLK